MMTSLLSGLAENENGGLTGKTAHEQSTNSDRLQYLSEFLSVTFGQ